jgi:hypothetical protein
MGTRSREERRENQKPKLGGVRNFAIIYRLFSRRFTRTAPGIECPLRLFAKGDTDNNEDRRIDGSSLRFTLSVLFTEPRKKAVDPGTYTRDFFERSDDLGRYDPQRRAEIGEYTYSYRDESSPSSCISLPARLAPKPRSSEISHYI